MGDPVGDAMVIGAVEPEDRTGEIDQFVVRGSGPIADHGADQPYLLARQPKREAPAHTEADRDHRLGTQRVVGAQMGDEGTHRREVLIRLGDIAEDSAERLSDTRRVAVGTRSQHRAYLDLPMRWVAACPETP